MSKELKEENAVIKKVTLGKEDHGIMTLWVHVEYASGGCGFGGFALCGYDEELKKRVGSAYGLDHIMEVLDTVGVEELHQLVGKSIRVRHEGWGGRIREIGNFLKDKWFNPEEHAKFWSDREK